MLGPAGRVQTAPSVSPGDGIALRGRTLLSWRAMLAAAVLSLALGAALYEGLGAGRSPVAPAAVRPHAFSGKGLSSLPLAAQGPVSAALGADSAAYRVLSASGSGLRAANPAQHLSTSFTGSGVSVTSGATHVGLSLRGVGYGSSLTAVSGVAPAVQANRVVYAHPGLSEWYANGPLGLEQGFTLARAPAGHAAGPLTLSMTLSGDVQASLAKGGQSITLSRAGKTVLRYTGLSATDARGRLLRSWLQLDRGRLLLRVDATGARYPLRIDPFILQNSELTAPTSGPEAEIGDGEFGYSVALSADGNTALIGGPADNGDVGAVWVFKRVSGTWGVQEKLTAPTSGSEAEIGAGKFGASVALSSDGDTALIGGPEDNSTFKYGAVWVFTSTGGPYVLLEKVSGGAADPLFGFSVALSSDGATALVGGAQYGYEGTVQVLTLHHLGGYYYTQTPLVPSNESSDGAFGYSVALSADGNTALIGGVENNSAEGRAWVFTRTSGIWTEQENFTAGVADSLFGSAVALSSDGNTALIGSYAEDDEVGAARVFTRSGFQQPYTLPETLLGAGEVDKGIFGVSVALSSNGNTALIGGPGYHDIRFGEAWVFERPAFGGLYVQQVTLTGAGEIGEGRFGIGVALACETALIGGEEDNSGVGAAWPFVNGPGPCPPHWYSNGQLLAPGDTVTVTTSGTLTFPEAFDAETEVTCTVTDEETIENPVGGGAGTDKVNQFTLSSCSIPPGHPDLCGAGTPEMKADNLSDWHTELISGSRDEITGIELEMKCSNGDAFTETLAGILTPTISNGVLTFDLGSGALTQISPYTNPTFVIGTDSLTGPVGDEQITAEELSRRVPEPPEFGRCVTGPSEKVGKKTVYLGGFTAATCLVASGAHTGKYEWEPGVTKAPFKTKLTSGAVTLESAVKASKLTCTGETSTGAYTGYKTVRDVALTLTGCTRDAEKCSSTGAAPGEIVTKSLEGQLGVIKREAAASKDKLGLDLYPAGMAGSVMEFICGSTSVAVQGSVIVPVTANKMSLTDALKFKASKGKQTPEAFEGAPKDILKESFDGGPAENAGLNAAITQTSEEKVEVNSVA